MPVRAPKTAELRWF